MKRRAAGALAAALVPLAALSSPPGRAAAAERDARPACTIAVAAAADGSFAEAGYDSSPARLARLAAVTGRRFAAAARRLCAAGLLSPADLAGFRTLAVQNGEGATEPVLYRDEPARPGVFIFQFAFQDGGPPPPKAFEEALRCWKSPARPGCFED